MRNVAMMVDKTIAVKGFFNPNAPMLPYETDQYGCKRNCKIKPSSNTHVYIVVTL